MLSVIGLTKQFGGFTALDDVSFEVREGEIVGLIGPNGAGKSTLMKTVFGLVRPRRGAVRFEGRDITGLAPSALVRRGLSYVPQVDNVFPSLTVEENLEMGAVVRSDDVRARLEEVLALFPNLQAKRRLKAGGLSGGERQMVAMGRALMLDPRLLLLDEPSAGLSPVLVDTVFEKIEAINRGGVAILLVEQSAREALRRSHRGYVLAGGQVRLEGPGPALLDDVGELMREQLPARARARVVGTALEEHVAAGREGPRAHGLVELMRRLVGVDTDVREVVPEGRLHVRTRPVVQRAAATTPVLDRPGHRFVQLLRRGSAGTLDAGQHLPDVRVADRGGEPEAVIMPGLSLLFRGRLGCVLLCEFLVFMEPGHRGLLAADEHVHGASTADRARSPRCVTRGGQHCPFGHWPGSRNRPFNPHRRLRRLPEPGR